mmetsp:Transcript_25879/g.67862  ORF Transcript_25879/g.67862 Transcript_25879/m.67862 type:complete len:333 (+) Transcript_25879:1482-2480(+)
MSAFNFATCENSFSSFSRLFTGSCLLSFRLCSSAPADAVISCISFSKSSVASKVSTMAEVPCTISFESASPITTWSSFNILSICGTHLCMFCDVDSYCAVRSSRERLTSKRESFMGSLFATPCNCFLSCSEPAAAKGIMRSSAVTSSSTPPARNSDSGCPSCSSGGATSFAGGTGSWMFAAVAMSGANLDSTSLKAASSSLLDSNFAWSDRAGGARLLILGLSRDLTAFASSFTKSAKSMPGPSSQAFSSTSCSSSAPSWRKPSISFVPVTARFLRFRPLFADTGSAVMSDSSRVGWARRVRRRGLFVWSSLSSAATAIASEQKKSRQNWHA